MRRYLYRIFSPKEAELNRLLKLYAEDGWEILSAFPVTTAVYKDGKKDIEIVEEIAMLFKKEVEDEEKEENKL